MKENTHVQAIPQDVLTQAQTKIQEVLTFLTPYLSSLTPPERQGMPKIGEKTSVLWKSPMILPSRTRILEF
jgi:hypothetical protein